MKVRELKELLNNPLVDRYLDDEVSIALSEPSMGPCAKSGIKNVCFGFDWDAGHLIITPDTNLVRLKEREALWQAASDLIYMLSQEKTHKGNETTLAKRAKSIIERSKAVK